jgi:DNA replication protein DnaC
MSRQLETTLSEAAAKNLSAAATLEWLADMELEARNGRAIERRFKCSRLQAQPSIDAFTSSSQEPLQEQEPHPASARSEFLPRAPTWCSSAILASAKPSLAKIIGWRACQANQRVLFTTAMDMLNHLLASQVDHSLVRKLKPTPSPRCCL